MYTRKLERSDNMLPFQTHDFSSLAPHSGRNQQMCLYLCNMSADPAIQCHCQQELSLGPRAPVTCVFGFLRWGVGLE